MPRHLKQCGFDSSIRERLARNELVSAGTKPEHSLKSAFPGRLLSFFLKYLCLGLYPTNMEKTKDA